MTCKNVRTLLLSGAAAAVFMLSAPAAYAIDFKMGEVGVKVDTTLTAGVGIRTSAQDCTFISPFNGGCTTGGYPATTPGNPTANNNVNVKGKGYSMLINEDDGNVNADRWQPYTTSLSFVQDIQLEWENYGAFVRWKGYYDYWGANKVGEHAGNYGALSAVNGQTPLASSRPLDDALRGDTPTDGNNRAGHGVRLLDAFAYTNFDVAGNPATLRIGNQVINWGESLFIQGGLNSPLPIDLTAIRTPGSELKQALLPVPAIYGSLGFDNGVSIEGYYNFLSQRTYIDTVGTFFSRSDAVSEGGAYVMNGMEYDAAINLPGANGSPAQAIRSGYIILRGSTEEAKNQGQFGLASHYYADWLNQGTDFGVYFENFHSPLPFGTFTAGSTGQTAQQLCGNVGFLTCATTQTTAGGLPVVGIKSAILQVAATKNVVTQYPEDIHMLGASFNTTVEDLLGGTALAGELAYSPNMPFQVQDVLINANDLALAQVDNYFCSTAPSQLTGGCAVYNGATTRLTSGRGLTAAGDTTPGYDRHNVLTGQIQTVSVLPTSNQLSEFLGSDSTTLLSNVGFQYITDLSDSSYNYLSIARGGAYASNSMVDYLLGQQQCPGGNGSNALLGNVNPDLTCSGAQYASPFSWGYRLLISPTYSNSFGTAWNVAPVAIWSHDVTGYAAGPIGPGFIQGVKKISVGLNFSYQDAWRVGVQWTTAFGNKFRNYAYDKDFATLSVSYAF